MTDSATQIPVGRKFPDFSILGADLTAPHIVLLISEVLINLLAVVATIAFVAVLYLTQTVHRNVKASLGNIALSIFIIAILRIVMICDKFAALSQRTSVTFSVELIRATASYNDIFIKVAVLVDRCAASLIPTVYAKIDGPVFVVFLLVLPWIGAGTFTVLFKLNILHPVHITGTLGSVMILSFLAYGALAVLSRRQYSRRNDVALNERYRVAENTRAMHMLFCWCAASTVRNVSMFASNTLIGWYLLPRYDWDGLLIATSIFDLTLAVYGVVAPAVVVFSHSEMRKHFRKRILRRAEVDVQSTANVRNVLGQPVIIDVTQDDHFRTLRDAWNT